MRVTLNRPERRNALSLELMHELIATLRRVSGEPETRARSSWRPRGPAFSAGHDLREMIGRDVPFFQRLFDVCTELMETIHRLPQPVIAKVHGMATAAGCQLVAACDLAVAADSARFATPGVKIGLFCSTPMVPLSARSAQARAGHAAHRSPDRRRRGARLGPPQPRRLRRRAGRRGRRSGRRDRPLEPADRRHGKEAFYSQIELDEHRAYDLTKAVMAMNARADDAQEGMCAFLDKRAPEWRGT